MTKSAESTTLNIDVPSLSHIYWILFLVVAAIVFNYLFTFRVIPGRPTENFTNCDSCGGNDYYEQYY